MAAPEGYRFRVAVPGDVPAIIAMRQELQRHMEAADPTLWRKNADGWRIIEEEVHADVASDDAIVVLAELAGGGPAVGVAAGKLGERRDLEPAEFGQIDDVWIDPAHRRRGLCRALTAELLDFFEARGRHHVFIRWVSTNPEADAAWRALGFVPNIVNAAAPITAIRERV